MNFKVIQAYLVALVALHAVSCATTESADKSASEAGGSAESSAPTCPVERSYGDPDAPNMLVFESEQGTRTLYFDEVVAAFDRTRKSGSNPGLWIRFPGFGRNLPFSFVMVPMGEAREGEVSTGYFKNEVHIDCMSFNFEQDLVGTMSLDKFVKPQTRRGRSRRGTAAGRFEFVSKQSPKLELSGRVQSKDVREVRYTPVVNKDAEARVHKDAKTPSLDPAKARVIFDEGAKRLYVRLLNEDGGVLTFVTAQDFDGKPGVYFGPPNTLTGLRESLVVVEKFGPRRFRVVEWSVEPEDMPKELPSVDELPEIGKVVTRIEVRKAVVFPDLEPLDLPDAPAKEARVHQLDGGEE